MTDQGIFIFGASDHARVVIDIVEREGRYRIAGLLDSYKPKGYRVGGHEVLGSEDDLAGLIASTGIRRGIVGIGDNWTRRKITHAIRCADRNFEFVTAIHPSAYITPGSILGAGTIVMGKAWIGIDLQIGEGCVVSTKASFEHDSTMADFSSLGAGVTCGGNVHLGYCSALCIGVTVIHGVHIGRNTVVGAGSTVLNDLPDGVVAYGLPAKAIRERQPCERYL
ncbi:MAG TPA: acetyltransferase [Bryobacteraceae bacterium]|nr:acetyltransferase [Bryobacteraceae bacterium]